MLDFTSALYLGLRHPSGSLRPWAQHRTGRPPALAIPASQVRVAQALAQLQGCEMATLSSSTLHLFWDLFCVLARGKVAIYMDAGTYAIAHWGVERAAACVVPVRHFPHHDTEALRQQLKQDARSGLQPLVVADGFYPGCDRPAPIAAYLEAAREYGGRLILDDTQALGIFGHSPGPDAPYGRGGGGSLRRSDVSGPRCAGDQFAGQGFGVPVAVLAGSEAMVRRFEASSETRVHCSPPSTAVVHVAEHALAVNKTCGNNLRLRLAQLVRHFRSKLKEICLSVTGGLFPVQTLRPVPELNAATLHERLLQCGIRTVLHCGRNDHCPRISFLITALHKQSDIDRAVDALGRIAKNWSAVPRISEVGHEIRTQFSV